MRWLAMAEQAARWRSRCPIARPFDLVEVALRTGLRHGEQFQLRREQIDFRAGVILVLRTKSRKPRSIPMHQRVREILEAQFASHASPWVWPSKKSGPVNGVNFYRRQFVPALERAGIRDLVWHDLRHTFASRLVMAGVDIRTVQELMGHATITMTMRYAHLAPSHKQAAIDRLP